MFNGKKVIMSMFIIMMIIGFYVRCSYSQEKPSEELVKGIIFRIEIQKSGGLYPLKITNYQVTNEFISKHNGRYCVEVKYYIESTSLDLTGMVNNKRYSFEKNGNQWYGWEGWGPGEE